MSGLRIGVLVVAYNAETTLSSVLDRIPHEMADEIYEVLVADDHSGDATLAVAREYLEANTRLPLTVVHRDRNLGYGGNQKAGYAYAIERGWDVVVLLHGDGQYAPELLADIVRPILIDRADAVFGSRMMLPGAARKGGMPLYKYVGNRILTTFQNRAAGASLSEWHSGYRAYRVDTIRQLDLSNASDGFNFDTQIILKLLDVDARIEEVPIRTYYGDEICYVNGLAYARDVVGDSARHALRRRGFGSHGRDPDPIDDYDFKPSAGSSHSVILEMLGRSGPGSVLDLGCGSGYLAAELRARGHTVTGVDSMERPGVRERTDEFFVGDLSAELPAAVTDTSYDVVIMADLLEHLPDPGRLLESVSTLVAPEGRVIVSVPNVGHWYPRIRFGLGSFDYDHRGILDRTHLRFFSRRSFQRLAVEAGYEIDEMEPTGLPLDVLVGAEKQSRLTSAIRAADRVTHRGWPSLFGFQFVFDLRPRRSSGGEGTAAAPAVTGRGTEAPTPVAVSQGQG